ncbi:MULTISPECIES: hypothetical protein [unclassified Streptomyces]|uniref:hypothetical protein n=1 Tax=unclassified Streptomyces TaxID=2593676 RepID=UPI0033E0199D
MDMVRLRRLIDGVLLTLYTRYTAKELPALCERLGLPPPGAGDTKHDRLVASLNACPDDHLPDVADAILEQEKLDQAERMALQDALWLVRHHVQVPSRTRHGAAPRPEPVGPRAVPRTVAVLSPDVSGIVGVTKPSFMRRGLWVAVTCEYAQVRVFSPRGVPLAGYCRPWSGTGVPGARCPASAGFFVARIRWPPTHGVGGQRRV